MAKRPSPKATGSICALRNPGCGVVEESNGQ